MKSMSWFHTRRGHDNRHMFPVDLEADKGNKHKRKRPKAANWKTVQRTETIQKTHARNRYFLASLKNLLLRLFLYDAAQMHLKNFPKQNIFLVI